MLKSSLITGGILALFLIHAGPQAGTPAAVGQSDAGIGDRKSVPTQRQSLPCPPVSAAQVRP
jgi:hypothetical protein